MATAASAAIRSGAEALWQEVSAVLPGFTVEVLAQVDSTNSELMRRSRTGDFSPTLLIAQEQTLGRGRMGRAWHAQPDAALTLSLGMALKPAHWSGLSLAVGLSLAESLHPDIGLKWPNDLYWRGKKLGGILVETATMTEATASRFVVVGMGLNLRTPSHSELARRAIGLDDVDESLGPSQVLCRIAKSLVLALLDFEKRGFAPLQAAFRRRDVLCGQPVGLSDGTDGVAQGVDARGALQVLSGGLLRTIDSLEVSVRSASPHSIREAHS